MPRKIPKKNRGGDCSYAAGRYISNSAFGKKDGENYILVHGLVNGQGILSGIKFVHAWVENGDMVIDKSNGRDINVPKVLYYALGNINPQETVRYTWKDVAEKMSTTGTYGPWDIQEPPIEGL